MQNRFTGPLPEEDSYEIEDGERTEHGTTIIMNITEGEEEFCRRAASAKS